MRPIRCISPAGWPWSGDDPPRKVLFDDTAIGLRIEVERHVPENRMPLESGDAWVEALVLPWKSSDQAPVASYVRLRPEATWIAGSGEPFDLLRCSYRGSFRERAGLNDLAPKHDSTVLKPYPGLSLEEIERRLPQEAGARTTRLFRTPSKQLITTLLEGDPGWQLEEHAHSTDVASICVGGGGTLTAGDDTWLREPFQAALIPAGASHAFVAGPTGVSLFIVVFPAGTLRG